MIKSITIGADPEVFLVAADNPERFMSGINLIGGTKYMPLQCEKGITIQEDNVAAEFATMPVNNVSDFIDQIQSGISILKQTIKEHNLDVVIVSSALFEEDQLLHPVAQVFGCDPDFNVWTKSINKPADIEIAKNLRSCGGHIHVGYDKPNDKDSFNLLKAMDLFLGVPSVYLDGDLRRKSLYGKAGCFRLKPYGVEYRTLSNFWLKDNELIKWAWEQTHKAISFVNDDQSYLLDNFQDDIVNAINTNDKTIADKLIKEFNLTLIEEFVCAD